MEFTTAHVKRLAHYIELTERDKASLGALEGDPVSFQANDVVYHEGDQFQTLFIVDTGWLYSSSYLIDGGRHIDQFYLPGDVVGLSDLAFLENSSTLVSCTATTIFPFPKQALNDVITHSPRVAALLLSLSARDQIMLIEQLRVNSQLDARGRLVHFLLSLYYRLQLIYDDMTTVVSCPLTKAQLGDCLGLTNVTISNSLGELTQEGWIKRNGDDIRLLRLDMMEALGGMQDRYAALDTSWFPMPN